MEALEPSGRRSLADVGFGGGLGLQLLLSSGHGSTVHGVEVSTAMLRRAQTRYRDELASGRLVLHQAPIERLPLSDSSLDGVISVNTLYFVADLGRAFAQLARVLSGSGRAVIGIGDPDAMKALPFTTHGFRLRPVEEITAALISAGLAITHHHRLDSGRVPAHVLAAEPAR